jgi:hypothetical protein
VLALGRAEDVEFGMEGVALERLGVAADAHLDRGVRGGFGAHGFRHG